MKHSRTIALLLLALGTAVTAAAQSWSIAYERGLRELQATQFSAARASFREATTLRPEDFDGATRIGGSVTDPVLWRSGSPYSPNLAAAYAAFRSADSLDDAARTRLYGEITAELATLLEKGQGGKEAVWILGEVFDAVRNVDAKQSLADRVRDGKVNIAWKNDPTILTPEHRAAVSEVVTRPAITPTEAAVSDSKPGDTKPVEPKPADTKPTLNPTEPPKANPTNPPANPTGDGPGTNQPRPPKATPTTNLLEVAPIVKAGSEAFLNPVPIAGPVLSVATKYALVIGNSESRLDQAAPTFGASDALLFRESLVQFAGYPETNVDLVINGSSAQILASAKALAERVPEGATVLVYFTGVGTNLEGKDYLAGIDSALATDTSTLVAKMDIFRLFMAKGARIFSFFQVSRPVLSGRYFGMEVPMIGAISQMQGTIPGGSINSMIRGGKESGLFTEAASATFREFRSGRVPIVEFAWSVFGRMQRGETGTTGGGSFQVPTLPVITNMASDARF